MSLKSKLMLKARFVNILPLFSRSLSVMTSMKEVLESKLKAEFDPIRLDVEDVSGGCGASFAVLIVSEKFKGKPMIAQHRAVNSAVKQELNDIHAFQIKSMTPEQWDKVKHEYS